MLLLALKDNFLCTYRFSLREARSCSGHCPPLQGSVTAAHGAMCTVSVSNTERTHFCCISPPLSNYGEIKAVSLAILSFVFTWGSKCICINPMSVQSHLFLLSHAGNFQGQRLLILGCSVQNRHGAHAKYLAEVPIYKTSNMWLNNPGFLQLIALYLFADRLLAEFSGKKGFVIC